MNNTIESYIVELKKAFSGADPALIQDAVWDAEAHLRAELAQQQKEHPADTEQACLARVIEAYGAPDEIAAAYLEREAVIEKALRPPKSPKAEAQPSKSWPSALGIFKTPKVYSSIVYLLLSLPVGIFFFTWAMVGIFLSLGLFPLIIGLPVAIAFLGSVRLLALAEGRLVEALLDIRMPRRPSLLPPGQGWWERLKNLILDGHTWSSLFYLLLHLPLGIFYFVSIVVGLVVSVSFIFAPIGWLFGHAVIQIDGAVFNPMLLAVLPILGGIGLFLTLHVAYALGRFQGMMAKHLLVQN